MRRVLGIILGVSLLLSVSSYAFAEEAKGGMDGKGMGAMMKGMMSEKGMMAMCPMRGAMMKMMAEKVLVATEDGGVVLFLGNKLIKYDKKLKLVSEAEVKIDTESMKNMMKKMKENFPMHKKMMEKGGMIGVKPQAAGSSKEAIDHKSHH